MTITAPFTSHSDIALSMGWFPIPVKGKSRVPSGVTGHKGVVDPDKVRKWNITREEGYDNLGFRHDGTVAIDVDVYDSKDGAATMAAFATSRSLPPLPPTYSSTARGATSPSRQYFYRLPEYVRLESKPRVAGAAADDVEICQFHHRFSVVYPSVHPDTGEVYTWYLPGSEGFSWAEATTDIPDVDDLPELPQEWIEALTKSIDSDLDFDAEVFDPDNLIGAFSDGPPSTPVLTAMELARTQHPGHDATYAALYKAFMYGREGHPGVKNLIALICSRHQEYLDTEQPERAARNELASIISDASTKAQQTPVTNPYRGPSDPIRSLEQRVLKGEEEFTGFTGLGMTRSATPTTDDSDKKYFVLPDIVWSFSPELTTIKQAALSRQVSPDVVLHATLAAIASLLPHQSRLETGKGPTVLSYYAVAVGDSGGGKTEALSCAEDLLSHWRGGRVVALGDRKYARAELGTGEGMVEAYMSTEPVFIPERADDGTELRDDDDQPIGKWTKEKIQFRHNAMFASDEGRQMLAQASRTGSTIMSTLCSMWSGTATGASNAKAENSRSIEKGSYILGLLLGFQPRTMAALFDDEAGGAPQRFAYASTEHPDITADEIEFPDGLSPRIPMLAPLKMELQPHHRRMVREQMRDRGKGLVEVGPLDGHRMLLLCRTAALLAVLHSSTEVTDEVMDLARVIVDKSCEFRDDLSMRAVHEAAEIAKRRQAAEVTTRVTSHNLIARSSKLVEVADKVVDKLSDGPLSRSELRRATAARLRDLFDEAIELVTGDGRVVVKEIDNPKSGPKTITVLALAEDDTT